MPKQKVDELPVPTESVEQQYLFQWARMQSARYPELELLHHIPNGGLRNKGTARRLMAEGVKAGVPDICLPVARAGSHGLYIEMKRQKGGRVTQAQMEWLDRLRAEGYSVAICEGFDQAAETILNYLKQEG